ncbi:transposase [Candidatus Parcubacteria bacterium]|nr:transposase [Candidatus Parcubacteria bacterium]
MNKRDYKITGEGGYFHIFNRGNGLQDIFLDDEDYSFFIFKLKQNIFPDEKLKRMNPLPDGSFSILSYCLLPNHFHLLLRQNRKYTMQQLLLRVCSSYSKYFNKKYKRVGHVFQDRFKQVNIEDDEQLLWIHAYINLNPVIDKKIEDIKSYKWSSYNDIIGDPNGFCDRSFMLEKLKDYSNIRKFFNDALPVLRVNKKLRNFKFE